ncbi:hypothetical protein LSAT2_002584 [Lamellibrachia satsuma]|nr:hypothetical protein LSAT2_002584 [Lamellibrachia satsuma]
MIDINVPVKYREDRTDGAQVIARKGNMATDRRTDGNPSTAHSELPDVNSMYKSTHHVAPDTASTASGHNMAHTSSGQNMASTSSGHNLASTSSGQNMASTSSGHNLASTSSGHNMASTSSGYSMASTSSGHSMAPAYCGHNMPSTSSEHNTASSFVGMAGRGVNMSSFCDACANRRHNRMPPNARKALEGATFIAKHLGAEDESKRVRDEWKHVALVIDRILLIVYVTVCVLGGMGILLRAPALYDYRMPLTG